jgi:methionyl-tRNA synthetase
MLSVKTPVYFTTPIYYPNDVPHIGTAYTTIAADILTRWMRLSGREAFLLTGLDEHGKKIETAAAKRGLSPQMMVDEQAEIFKETFISLNIKYDRFIRTTDADHALVVREILNRVYTQGDIYKGVYEGLYCVDCEAYYTEKELNQGNCPVHHRPVELLREDCYYFRLSNYRDWLLQLYNEHPEFIQPSSRRNEVINFISGGLEDLNISRSNFSWGIPLPFDKTHVTYVWFDALLNYITGIGYLQQPSQFARFWGNSNHLIGKDILRFHAVIFPAMLKSAGIAPPKRIFAHGFWTINGKKFSKSLGNAISPLYLIESYGLDPLRYYMFRAFPFGSDGDFSEADLVQRNNSELAQGLGNLVQRTTAMIEKYSQGIIPLAAQPGESEQKLIRASESVVKDVSIAMENLSLHKALDKTWNFIAQLNSYVNVREPWNLAQTDDSEALNTTLATLAEGIRFVATLTAPFIPDSSKIIAQRLGLADISLLDELIWGNSLAGKFIKHDVPIFPQLEQASKEE